jgi:multicomponent Na+:H+ antiporter subunit E
VIDSVFISATFQGKILRTALTILTLFALWLLMSGVYDPLIIGLGAASSILAAFVGKRMNAIDGQPLEIHISFPRLFAYFAWLFVEIAKSNWMVAKLILAPRIRLRQNIFEVPYSQKTDLGQTIFANSITLTPGTITVEVEEGYFLVHALAFSEDDHAALAEMDRRVTATESGGA